MLFNEDQLAIRDLARRFAREKLTPQYQSRDKSGILDRGLIREMGTARPDGGSTSPKRSAGLALPGSLPGIIAEETRLWRLQRQRRPGRRVAARRHHHERGTPKLASHWIPRMIRGETLMGVCVTEPSAGSDASAMKLRCRRDGGHYVLDGEKTSITFADCADAFIVFARTGTPESGAAWRSTALIVSRRYPGRCAHPFQ